MSLHISTFAEALTAMRSHGRDTEAPWFWNGLVGNWMTLQGGGGTQFDTSGQSKDGTLVGLDPDTDWVISQNGYVLDYDAASDWVAIPQPPGLATEMTFSGWILARSLVTWGSVSKNWPNTAGSHKFHFGLYSSSGDISTFIREADGTEIGPVRESVSLSTNVWYHVAFTCGGGFVRVYRDGHEVGTALAYDGTLNEGDSTFYIGSKGPYATPGDWDGLIGDCAMHNRALSPDEIQQIYQDPSAHIRPRAGWVPSAVAAAPPTGGGRNVIIGGGILA